MHSTVTLAYVLFPLQEEEERQKEVSQMQASLEQMQAANEEHRQKQQDAEARLATLKVMLGTSMRYTSLACHAVCGALQVSVRARCDAELV